MGKSRAENAAGTIRSSIGGAIAGAAAADVPGQARVLVNERLTPALHTARDRVSPALHDARDRVGDAVEEHVVPALHDAGDRLAPVLVSARARAGETARDVGGRLADRAEPVAHEAARRGANALEALRGAEIAPPRRRKGRAVRRLLFVSAIAGASYAAWRALSGRSEDPWQDSTAADNDRFGAAADTVSTTAAGVAGTVAGAAKHAAEHVRGATEDAKSGLDDIADAADKASESTADAAGAAADQAGETAHDAAEAATEKTGDSES